MPRSQKHIGQAIVVGAGIAGLCAAARLCAAGFGVTVIEQASAPGGKIRSVPSPAGPVDAGPTVMTLKPVFDDVFRCLGEKLDDHLQIEKCETIARHVWPDGSQLDLSHDPAANITAIGAFSDSANADAFEHFHRETRALYDTFRSPMMETPEPSLPALGAAVMRKPALLRAIAPGQTLDTRLSTLFSDRRLVQLFGRYATYVGGSPFEAPALLGLIWQAEAAGVWTIPGGMAQLPLAIEALCIRHGVTFLYNSVVTRLKTNDDAGPTVILDGGRTLKPDVVVFNGDPRALAKGALGPDVAGVASDTRTAPRSLSALVWSFAAKASGFDMSHHNVFFSADNAREFSELANGHPPSAPTLYVCAQDRNRHGPAPSGSERFEIIINAPALSTARNPELDFETWQNRTFQTLAQFGLTFDPLPGPQALTQPSDFASLFPESLGSLYGQSPHGMTASLKRPRAKTSVPGLYLAGGGAHPGAGIPMAALSARHAVETIMKDRTSRFASRQTAMHGGI